MAVVATAVAGPAWAVSGDISTVAGGLGPSTATSAAVVPTAVATKGASKVYVAESAVVRVLDTSASPITQTPVAGNGTAGFINGSTALSSELNGASALALDSSGNLYIADTNNHRVRKVSVGSNSEVDGGAGETISTVAGTGDAGYSGDCSLIVTTCSATSAQLSGPDGLAFDASGNLYIADRDNHRIRKVDTSGKITTYAGIGVAGYGGDGGPASLAALNGPSGLAFDASGNLYLSDTGNHRVRQVNSLGLITTVAGTGVAGYGGDCSPPLNQCPPAAAQLDTPVGISLDASASNLYIADSFNNRIRRVDLTGSPATITTAAGDGTAGFSDGSPATAHKVNNPTGVAVRTAGAGTTGLGAYFVADTANRRVRQVNTGATISTVAGNGNASYSGDGGAATAAQLNFPQGVQRDGSGNLYFADDKNNRIRKVDTSATPTISTVAGNGNECAVPTAACGDGGAATSAQLKLPKYVLVNSSGNLYVADTLNHRVRFVNQGGSAVTVHGVSVGAGQIATVAGTGAAGFSDGATATTRQLNYPVGLSLDSSGNLYIADFFNRRVRKLDTSGTISTAAGNGASCSPGPCTEGTSVSATAASPAKVLQNPIGVTVDGSGNLYVADQSDNRIRFVNQSGAAVTVNGVTIGAGNIDTVVGGNVSCPATPPSPPARTCLTAPSVGDGGGALSARLSSPFNVALSGGNLYISDEGNNRIRFVNQSGAAVTVHGVAIGAGNIATVAGDGTRAFGGDGAAGTAAYLHSPRGVAVDGSGNLYLADSGNNRIRKVLA